MLNALYQRRRICYSNGLNIYVSFGFLLEEFLCSVLFAKKYSYPPGILRMLYFRGAGERKGDASRWTDES